MALHFKVQLVVVADDDEQLSVDDIVVLNKEHARAEHLVWPSVESEQNRGRLGGHLLGHG
jgi:hypothetical protein